MEFFIIGIIISLIYDFLFLPRKHGVEPTIHPTIYPIIFKGMVIIALNKKKAIHIHHWIIFLLVSLIGFYYDIPNIFKGIALGLFIQGIEYHDWYKIICPNPYTTKINPHLTVIK